jgi:hypothetical protein
MQQTSTFEERHPFLLHCGILLAALLTYLFDREDVVWRFIKASPNARLLEHLCFGLATVVVGAAIWLGAWPLNNNSAILRDDPQQIRRRCLGEILHAIGIGSLLPLSGFILLTCGESIRASRYAKLKMEALAKLRTVPEGSRPMQSDRQFWIVRLFLAQPGVCCAFLSMAVFSITLVDRLAEILFAGTAFVSLFSFLHSRND